MMNDEMLEAIRKHNLAMIMENEEHLVEVIRQIVKSGDVEIRVYPDRRGVSYIPYRNMKSLIEENEMLRNTIQQLKDVLYPREN